MPRGFFSGFVAIMGVLLLIALFYTHATRDNGVSQTDELLIGHSLLNRDWALARNAYSQFASDAIAAQIRASSSCAVPALSNFTLAIANNWGIVRNHLRSAYGVDCIASVNVDLQNDMGISGPVQVSDNRPAYAILSCERTIAGVKNTLQHPFVIWKDVEVSTSAGNICNITVYDMLGLGGYGAPPPFIAIEVQDTFPYT